MKTVKIILGMLVSATILVLLGFYWWSNKILPAEPNNPTKVSFVITKNEPASTVVEELTSRGLIKSAFVGKIYLRLSGIGPKIQAGAYSISPDQSMQDILFSLTSGPTDVWVTIPEGWRREQIAARLEAKLAGPDAVFKFDGFVTSTASLEGKLFPDTYLVPTNASVDLIVKQMTTNFTKKVSEVTPQQLILASLIEREAKADSERPIIAGILTNRLKAGWPLQIDATIQYAQGNSKDWWPEVTNTKLASIYNTYLHTGLPPRPICNPGLLSIQAAQNPARTDYWYYLHDNEGQAHFAKTIAEHVSNIDKYLRP